ncbi:MAG: insulinase family protein [Chlorobi bacterium]|nr:insulinase family protein [Chlorobiota bacterium]
MKRLLFPGLMTVLLLLSNLMIAQEGRIKFTEYDLDNGLHVILHQDSSVPIVSVSVMYHVGSKNEDPNLTGFAHFFEHLMFEGTENIGRGEYAKYVEKAGGTLNANTSNDRTYYYEILPSNQLKLGLWLESERMLHARVDSVGIATQKKVVSEEKKQSYDNRPYGSLLIEMMKRAYKVHPYRWTTIGDMDQLLSAKDEDFVNFYKTFYVPNNAVLVVAGDINPDSTKQWINDYFAGIPRGTKEIPRPDVVEPPQTQEIRDTIYDNIQLPLIAQGYHIPAMNTPDYYAVMMLSSLLSDGQSSRLYKELVDKKQMAVQVGSFPLPFRDPSLALIYALPNMGVDPKALEDEIDAEIDKVKENLISEKEFEKLRNKFENDYVSSNERLASRAENLATDYTYFKNTDLVNHELDKILAVTREDIKRVANKYFDKNNRVVLYYLPKSQEKAQQ